MSKQPVIYAMIPARFGSIRLKMKNSSLIDGKPMISYAIKAAKDSNVFNRVIVNSDGYSLKDGKKSVKTDELLSMNGRPKKKDELERVHPNSFNGNALSQIPWLINICAFKQSNMVRQ